MQDKSNKLVSSLFRVRRRGAFIFSTIALTTLSWGFSMGVGLAADPFRTNNARDIGEKTEQAFKALFEEGNYPRAKRLLDEAKQSETNDPLVPALRASLAYTEEDWSGMESYANETVRVARAIATADPLRSSLYLAVGNFLQGAHKFQTSGPMAAIGQLQSVFRYFEQAERIDRNDPELNLIKGYFNLILAVNLPFSSPTQAINQLQQFASPQYLVHRGIAIAYRDLKDFDQALTFANKAVQSTPNNPEIHYLRGQILREKGMRDNNVNTLEEALRSFDIAMEKIDQTPVEATQEPLRRDRTSTIEALARFRGFTE
ncbi:Tetratricopeptide repeat protein [Cyanobacterium stanieri PCC 7202]|uniref:Tetratricopeptide repeat protein n=1 Tax=Cyanobacterium stanieri (strain ATCC 29140 / PCC 7202) TaxID=292563 RepID=K9YLP7_CYASC|nr:Tetratricopeptide repeat protein [Cyanobacterium stanieri PCC 7202]